MCERRITSTVKLRKATSFINWARSHASSVTRCVTHSRSLRIALRIICPPTLSEMSGRDDGPVFGAAIGAGEERILPG